MRVTACVVSYNTRDHLPGCLDALRAQDHPALEVAVIDNASADGSAGLVATRFPDVRLLANDSNRGYAGAANQALRLAGDGALLLCNPDVRPAPDYIRHALAALRADPRTASVQGKLLRLSRDGGRTDLIDTTGHQAFTTRLFRNRGEGEADAGQWDTAGEVFGVSGACALYRTAALHDVAVHGEAFDHDLFAFWEDVDLDWRLQMRGWRARYEPLAHGWHERGGAGARRSATVERLNFANRFLVVLKNDDPRALARALPGVLATSTLKAAELAVTVPAAFLGSFAHARLVPRILAKRRVIHAQATVPAGCVVARWFAPFDYGAWVATWWRRVRGHDPAAS